MGKKIMIVCGSPRKSGNTALLAEWVAEGAREVGADVEIVDAAHLKYKTNGCTACMGCQESEEYRCIIKDEASDLIASIPEKDILVFASPVYFFGLSAQTKLFMDRMYSLFKFRDGKLIHKLKDIELALIADAAGDLGSGLDITDATIKKLAGFLGRKHKSLLVPNTPQDPGETTTHQELREKAMDFGAGLAQG
jgi:multimeric flavodoxin WrbA